MCSPHEWEQKGQFFKILTGLLLLRSSFSSSLFTISLSFLFPSWSMLDKHLGISFSSVKRYPPRKIFGFAKIFLEKIAILCDVVLPDSTYWNPFSSFQKITKKASLLFENYLEQGTSKCLIVLHVLCSKSDTSCASWQLIKTKIK